MSCVRQLSAVLTVLVVSGGAPSGQTAGATAQPRSFRSGVDVVGMTVTVTDRAGRYRSDLAKEDFQVFEDGRREEVTFFQKRNLPLALTLLMDTSASMDSELHVAQEAAVGFVQALEATDMASVIDFNASVRVAQAFTTDRPALDRAIRGTVADGSTALYNALYVALREMRKTIRDEPLGQPWRRAIVILSDGEDTSSLVTFDEALDAAARSDTAIYAIGLYGQDSTSLARTRDAQYVLRRLTQQTGGRVFFVADAKELHGVYAEIRAELANQYFLAYQSSNTTRDARFRRVAIRIGRPDATARARPGYYALDR